ncbi:SCO1 protein [Lysinibacillus alkalisoli]|uniref:SCO1 protein n=1 Tax=Lysinibacillus alkalisoli TaxID=1911548 RepID=A0A917G1Y7_9BACI|nr:SCO family protein [Lysinibacillus alkalisoli]GGG19033.1 SCO1 protein [Lysinibacillus alkalisoli]
MKKQLVVMMFTILLIITGCSNYKVKQETDIEVQDFTHKDQRGEEVSLEDLKGSPWLATFLFTNCTTVCPPMTANLTEVQEALKEAGVEDYKIVAFSIDPDNDSPEVIQAYLDKYPIVDESKWHYLTGYDQTYIEQYAKKSFNAHVKDDVNSDQVIHTTYFHLVTPDGKAIKSYDGIDVPVEVIVEDLKTLGKN